ncbi:MAG: thioredoxin [Thermoguttaceae bacterium]|nr:thioredoxin [Thermoguttaceae bacterium]
MSEALEIVESNFEEAVLKETRPVLVDFWTPTCGPCRLLAPVIAALANANEGKAVVAKCDASANMNLAVQLSISAVPTIVLFKNGQIVARLAGVQKQAKLQELIDANL